jgi:uncharacterized protein YmfQ (DUF2313 family)
MDEITLDRMTDILCKYYPDGIMWEAKYIEGSNLRNTIKAKAKEFLRSYSRIFEIRTQYNIRTTTTLIDEWEKMLGIPDECFSNIDILQIRREQSIAKLARVKKLVTDQNYQQLAKIFNVDMEVLPAHPKHTQFPYTFPIIFCNDEMEAVNTIIVHFLTLNDRREVFENCILKYKMAHIHIIFLNPNEYEN